VVNRSRWSEDENERVGILEGERESRGDTKQYVRGGGGEEQKHNSKKAWNHKYRKIPKTEGGRTAEKRNELIAMLGNGHITPADAK